MRLSTHIAFGVGVAGVASSHLLDCSITCWILSMVASATVNIMVDIMGHDHRLFRPPARTKVTHSLPGIIGISIAVAWLIQKGLAPPLLPQPYKIYTATIIGGLSHWLLDALNPTGVYVVKGRFRIARIPYHSLVANMVLQMIGGGLLLYSAMRYYGVPG